MDTILRNLPMPRMILSNLIRDERTYRTVIDGQQRINAILSFLHNEFCLKSLMKVNTVILFFKDLPEIIKTDFLSYTLKMPFCHESSN